MEELKTVDIQAPVKKLGVIEERKQRYLEQCDKVSKKIEYEQTVEDSVVTLNYKGYTDPTELRSSLYAASGSINEDYSHKVMTKNITAFIDNTNVSKVADETTSYIATLSEMAPRDVIDGIFCRRILTLEAQINEFQIRAMNSTYLDTKNQYVNWTVKLSRVLNETVEARNKYLSKGSEQKVTVTYQHVQVNGGQNVIGNVERGDDEKR